MKLNQIIEISESYKKGVKCNSCLCICNKHTDQYQTMSNKKIAKPSTTPAMTPPIVVTITGEYAMQCSTLLSKVAFYRAYVVMLKQCFCIYFLPSASVRNESSLDIVLPQLLLATTTQQQFVDRLKPSSPTENSTSFSKKKSVNV